LTHTVTLHFEKRSLTLILDLLRELTDDTPSEISYGYLIFQKLEKLCFQIGSIDRLDVPYGQVMEWEPRTVICCDDCIMRENEIFVHFTRTPRNVCSSIYKKADDSCEYLSYIYKWPEEWKSPGS
jgi:hypothetical protein